MLSFHWLLQVPAAIYYNPLQFTVVCSSQVCANGFHRRMREVFIPGSLLWLIWHRLPWAWVRAEGLYISLHFLLIKQIQPTETPCSWTKTQMMMMNFRSLNQNKRFEYWAFRFSNSKQNLELNSYSCVLFQPETSKTETDVKKTGEHPIIKFKIPTSSSLGYLIPDDFLCDLKLQKKNLLTALIYHASRVT